MDHFIYDISAWELDPDIQFHTPGAMEKILFKPLGNLSEPFITNKRYLLKFHKPGFPCQFWSEYIACKFAEFLKLPVQKSFLARYNNRVGVLLEWFTSENEEAHDGGVYMRKINPSYDSKKGKQNNLEDFISILTELEKNENFQKDWYDYIIKMFTFDALICNIDRHQDNWCIIKSSSNISNSYSKFSLIYDNGTSLGSALQEEAIQKYNSGIKKIESYLAKGRHHIKYKRNDDEKDKIKHVELIKYFINISIHNKKLIENILTFDIKEFESSIINLTLLKDIKTKQQLSTERLKFMLSLIQSRQNEICLYLNNLDKI